MSTHRAGRSGDARRRTGQGGVSTKYCPACNVPVMVAFKGEVTAAPHGRIECVAANGDIRGTCDRCGQTVT